MIVVDSWWLGVRAASASKHTQSLASWFLPMDGWSCDLRVRHPWLYMSSGERREKKIQGDGESQREKRKGWMPRKRSKINARTWWKIHSGIDPPSRRRWQGFFGEMDTGWASY